MKPTLYDTESALRIAFERHSELMLAQETTPTAELNADLAVAERSLIAEIETALLAAAEKRDGLAWFIRTGNMELDGLRAEAQRVQRIADRLATHLERIMAYVKQVMEAHQLESLQGATSRFSFVQNAPHVEVGTIALLPPECVRVIPEQREPNKVEIAKRLKAGDDVPGARLVPGGKRLKLSDKRV